MTKQELIQTLQNIPDSEELAIGVIYTIGDIQEMVNENITDDQWREFAYWFTNDERLNDDALATMLEVSARLGISEGE